MSTDTRAVPYSIEAEESLLGAVLRRQSIMVDLSGVLDPSDFYNPRHQQAYQAMLDLFDHGDPIDEITVSAKTLNEVSIPELSAMSNAVPSVSAYSRYSEIIVEMSRRRRMISHFAELTDRLYQPGSDVDEVLNLADPGHDRLIAPRTSEISDLYTLPAFMQSVREVSDEREWLLPGILKALWRVIIVAPEGIGKGTLMRFLALHAAAGRDPWAWNTGFFPQRKVLYIDVENAQGSIAHQIRIANRAYSHDVHLETEAAEHFHIWHREGGINLRDRRPRAELEAILQHVRPDIVFAGPLYKLYRRTGREDMEQAALEFTEVLDGFRTRFNFALVLEHHAPKATGGGYREMVPFGSSLWQRWPEFGLTLEPVGNVGPHDTEYDLEVGRFRRDREVADWPNLISRGKSHHVPWTGRWNRARGSIFADYA